MQLLPLASLLSGVLLAPCAAQNLLANPGFDSGGLAGWSAFGNAFAEAANPPAITPLSGSGVCKIFGNFSGGFDVSGVFQSFPAAAGQTFTMDCWTRHWSGDPLLGVGPANDNWAVMKMAFFDAGGTEIGAAEQIVLDGTSPQDVWIDNPSVTGTAPAGTTSVQALLLYLQPGNAGGAALFDDVEFVDNSAGSQGTVNLAGVNDYFATPPGLPAPMTPSPSPIVQLSVASQPIQLTVQTSNCAGTTAGMPVFALVNIGGLSAPGTTCLPPVGGCYAGIPLATACGNTNQSVDLAPGTFFLFSGLLNAAGSTTQLLALQPAFIGVPGSTQAFFLDRAAGFVATEAWDFQIVP